jgi:lantibiotic biosynthesis protein
MTFAGSGHYDVVPFALVRSAALATQKLQGLTFSAARAMAKDEEVGGALAAASPSFRAALMRADAHGAWERRDDVTLLKYLNRMSSRPAPYGLLAGVSVVPVGETTSVIITSGVSPRYRPDSKWLSSWVEHLESRPEVAVELEFKAHPAVSFGNGRLTLHRSTLCDDEPVPTIRASPLAKALLAKARDWVPYADLVQGNFDEERVRDVVSRLCKLGFLVSSLGVVPGDPDPLATLVARMGKVDALRDETEHLAAAGQRAVNAEENYRSGSPAIVIGELRSEMSKLWPDGDHSECLQVDGVRQIAGEIGERIAQDAATLAEVLLRVNPSSVADEELEACRSALVEAFSPDASVNLLTALGTLDQVADPGHKRTGNRAWHPRDTRRDRQLAAWALAGLHADPAVIELDRDRVAKLAPKELGSAELPRTLDICVQVAASSTAAIAAGDYQVVAAPVIGALTCGRIMGRFGAALGEQALKLGNEISRAWSCSLPQGVVAQVAYMPSDRRTLNVTARPFLGATTLYAGSAGGGGGYQTLELGDLMLRIERGRLSLWLADGSQPVTVIRGDMINRRRVPFVVRFLEAIGSAGQARLSAFDWGTLSFLPALPRVQMGRLVLSTAEWRISVDDLPKDALSNAGRFREAIKGWHYGPPLPRHVYVSDGDRRLFVDLHEPDQLELVRSELKRRRSIRAQEALPGPGEAWLSDGSGQTYSSELVFSLTQRQRTRTATKPLVPPPQARRPVPWSSASSQPRFLPGSAWAYLKLYCEPDMADRILLERIAPHVQQLQTSGAVDEWFFVRYSDPSFHIRLRLHASRCGAQADLLATACAYAAELVSNGDVLRFCVETYEPEQAKYGGAAGLAITERAFTLDSTTVLDLLDTWPAPSGRLDLAIVSVADMILVAHEVLPDTQTFGLTRMNWTRDGGRTYRDKRSALLAAWASEIAIDSDPSALGAILYGRRVGLRNILDELATQWREGCLQQNPAHMLSNYVHMHCNRMGLNRPEESSALEIAQRLLNEIYHRAANHKRLGPAEV